MCDTRVAGVLFYIQLPPKSDRVQPHLSKMYRCYLHRQNYLSWYSISTFRKFLQLLAVAAYACLSVTFITGRF